jgi:chromosomal replication initiator protein
MYLSRILTDSSLPRIGQMIGGRDHTTVMHGFAKVEELIKTAPTIRAAVEDISKQLKKG